MNDQGKKTLTPHEFAERYGFSVGTLANLRYKRLGPKYYRVGARKILYYVEDIEKWIKACPVLTIDSLPEDRSRLCL